MKPASLGAALLGQRLSWAGWWWPPRVVGALPAAAPTLACLYSSRLLQFHSEQRPVCSETKFMALIQPCQRSWTMKTLANPYKHVDSKFLCEFLMQEWEVPWWMRGREGRDFLMQPPWESRENWPYWGCQNYVFSTGVQSSHFLLPATGQ